MLCPDVSSRFSGSKFSSIGSSLMLWEPGRVKVVGLALDLRRWSSAEAVSSFPRWWRGRQVNRQVVLTSAGGKRATQQFVPRAEMFYCVISNVKG